MYPGDNEAGKRTVGPFSKTPLIRYPAGSLDFSPGPRVPLTQPSSQVSSLPLSAASPIVSPPWTSSTPSFFHDSLPTWIPSESSPPLLLGGSSSVPIEDDIDFSIGFNQNPSFSPPTSNSMTVSGNTVPLRGTHRRAHSVIFGPNDIELISNGESSHHGKKPTEKLSDESMELNAEENRTDMIQTKGVKRRAENRPYTPEELQKISASKRLTELASNPKKVRLILANRETAKRSRLRKTQYTIELETKVATLLNENASLKTKLAISETQRRALELRAEGKHLESNQYQ